MVKQHRVYVLQLKKNDSPHRLPSVMYYYEHGMAKKPKPTTLLRLRGFLLLLLLSPLLWLCLSPPSFFPLLCNPPQGSTEENRAPPCSAMTNGSICCDRTSFRTDICSLRGDVRTHSAFNSIFLVSDAPDTAILQPEERVRAYTRKWETSVMSTIDELRLRHIGSGDPNHKCNVRHKVPAIVFSTGGYTGNVYHEFNDGIIPLYITSQRFNRKVVFVILEYHSWWMTKYKGIVSRLSKYKPIDFSRDQRTHCFPEVIVGLHIHDELTVDAVRMANNKTMRDFRKLLDEAYRGRILYLDHVEEPPSPKQSISSSTHRPKLTILSRTGSREIENEAELVASAEEIGFDVQVLRPDRTTELCKIYRALNASDAMVGVHGAAMTHFLFMRPGKVFVQIVPLGTDWAAETYYGVPAARMGLRYVGYKILPRESSLYREYPRGDPVLVDPSSVAREGWGATKRVYLDRQNVRLDMARFRKRLVSAYQHLVSNKQQR